MKFTIHKDEIDKRRNIIRNVKLDEDVSHGRKRKTKLQKKKT